MLEDYAKPFLVANKNPAFTAWKVLGFIGRRHWKKAFSLWAAISRTLTGDDHLSVFACLSSGSISLELLVLPSGSLCCDDN
jgi:hypothetical protein